MMSLSILKNWALSIDGVGYWGKVESFKEPDIKIMTEDVRNGGMDIAVDIDMGQEKMTGQFTLVDYNATIMAKVGLKLGIPQRLIFKGAIENDYGVPSQVTVILLAKLRGVTNPEMKAGEIPKMTYDYTAFSYSKTINDQVIYSIDANAMIRIVDGVDQLAGQRLMLGI
jgi:P2 family phage contractile tail tube protein